MKKHLLIVLVCCSCFAQAQLTVNNTTLTATNGTIVSFDGLVLTPSSTLNITNNTITKTDSAVIIKGVNSIKRKYAFANSLNYTGTIGIKYNANELNGNSESSLRIAYSLYGTSYTLSNTSNTNANGSYYVNDNFNNTSLISLTATTACTPSISSTNIAACNSYLWNGVTYTQSGTYTFNTANSVGCDSTATLILTVNKTTYSYDTTNVCSNQLPYSWNGLIFTNAGTQSITLLNSNSCDSIASLNVIVGSAVTPSVSISGLSNVCSNVSVTYTANPSNEGAAPTYQWKKSGVIVGTSSSITFAAGVLTSGDIISCIMTANNVCQTNNTATSNSITVTVKTAPNTTTVSNNYNSTSNSSLTVCKIGTQVTLYPTTTGGVWNSDNTAVATTSSINSSSSSILINTLSNGGATINYTLTNNNGCSSVSSISLIIAEQATPNNITGSSSLCVGSSTTYSSATSGGIWSTNGRTTITTAGIATGTSAGSTSIVYTVTNAQGCSASVSKVVSITALAAVPSIGYAPSNLVNPTTSGVGLTFCSNRTFTLAGKPIGGSWSTTGVATITGGGVVSTGLAAGSTTIKYTTAGACSNSRTLSATVVVCASRGVKSEQFATNSLQLYPNPAHSLFTINCKLLTSVGSIVVTDLYGKQVKQQALSLGVNTIDVSSFAKGMYLVSVITEQGKQTQKLVVE